MVSTISVPPRPAHAGPCTCVWPAEFERQRLRVQDDMKMEKVTSPVTGIVNRMLPGDLTIPGSTGNEKESVGDESTDDFPARRSNFAPSTLGGPPHMNGSVTGTTTVKAADPVHGQAQTRQAADRGNQKRQALGKAALGVQQKPDVVARKFKKNFAKSSENKLRDLFSYREDLVVCLSSLIPAYQQIGKDHPVFHPDSHLCQSCASTLAHNLYYSPARFEPYLAEHSTRGYLTLIDDAVASYDLNAPMETISHHELERVLRGELAVIEWRITLKMAKFHARTNYLNLFPIRMGEYAELRPNKEPPSQPEGFFKKMAKKGASTVGLGSSSAVSMASPQNQVSGPNETT